MDINHPAPASFAIASQGSAAAQGARRRRGGGRTWPGKVQGVRDAHPRVIGGVGRCGDNSGEPARWRKVAAATAARALARGVAMWRNWRQG
jgi:hypothetical protein